MKSISWRSVLFLKTRSMVVPCLLELLALTSNPQWYAMTLKLYDFGNVRLRGADSHFLTDGFIIPVLSSFFHPREKVGS